MRRSVRNPMKLLLHACCGPCSLEPTRILRAAGHDLTLYYANSNIAPAEEYAHRLGTLRTWAGGEGLPVVEGPYDPAAWEATAGRVGEAALAAADGDVLRVATHPALREARCRACYRLRFEEAARVCLASARFDCRGHHALGKPLPVHPQVIREELERASGRRRACKRAASQDYRPFYDEATRRSRATAACTARTSAAAASPRPRPPPSAPSANGRAPPSRPRGRGLPPHADERAAAGSRPRRQASRTSGLRREAGPQARRPARPARAGARRAVARPSAKAPRKPCRHVPKHGLAFQSFSKYTHKVYLLPKGG